MQVLELPLLAYYYTGISNDLSLVESFLLVSGKSFADACHSNF